jgi:hypothetical protein
MIEPKHEPRLSLDANLETFFREIVEETASAARNAPDPTLQEYVVGLLEDAAIGDDNVVRTAVDRPLALLLAEAMASKPSERFERLRQTGDGILIVGGLYRRHLQRAGLQDRYVVALGQRAYRTASSLLEIPTGGLFVGEKSTFDILHELALAFEDLMVFLRAVSDTLVARAAKSASDIARLCELWLTDRSAHLGRLLRARGVVLDAGMLTSS